MSESPQGTDEAESGLMITQTFTLFKGRDLVLLFCLKSWVACFRANLAATNLA